MHKNIESIHSNFALLLIINFMAQILSRALIGGHFSIGQFIAHAVIAALIACPTYLALFDKKYFCAVHVTFNGIGILYLMWNSSALRLTPWGDVVSLIGYLIIVGAGIVLGVLIESVLYGFKKSRSEETMNSFSSSKRA